MSPIRRTVPGMSPPALPAAPGLLALALLSAACESAGSRSLDLSVDTSGVSVVTSDPLSSTAICPVSAEPRLTIGTSEGEDPERLPRVRGAARLPDGSIAVAEDGSGELRLFDSTGAHRRTMGGRGEGPGEFRNPWGVWALPGDTLWVGDIGIIGSMRDDRRPWRFNVFGPDGRFVRAVQPEPLFYNTPTGGGVLSGASPCGPGASGVRILTDSMSGTPCTSRCRARRAPWWVCSRGCRTRGGGR